MVLTFVAVVVPVIPVLDMQSSESPHKGGPHSLGGPGSEPASGATPASAATAPAAPPPPIPTARHVAIIMDGNGRWAQQRGLLRLEGHKQGAHAVRDTVRAARQMGLPALTLYAFSEQNWGRPLDEVSGLMQLLHDYIVDERSEILENGIRVRTIGNSVRLPTFVRRPLEALIAETANLTGMTLSLALSYGGRESITDAARGLLTAVAEGRLRPEDIDEEMLSAAMQTSDLPPVDLIIRTSGERRISNFLLWEGVRALFYTTPCLWPDFQRRELYQALLQCHLAQTSPLPAAPPT
jgi:undecaprenyl diphosphate synthase